MSCQGRAPHFAPRTRFHRLQAIHSTGHSLGVSLMRISLFPVISVAFKAGNGSRCVERALAEAFTPRSEPFVTVSAGAAVEWSGRGGGVSDSERDNGPPERRAEFIPTPLNMR